MVRDIAAQVPLFGEMTTPDEWWLFIFAGLYGQDVVENPFRQELPTAPRFIVRNNKRTKDLTVSTGAELITLLYAFGNNRSVDWSDPKWKAEMASYQQEAEQARKAA